MKMISKKVLTTTIAASVILGGGVIGLLQTSAFADTSTSTKSTDDAAVKGKDDAGRKNGFGKGGHGPEGNMRGGFGGGNLLKETATIVGSDEKTVSDQVKAGQTLLDIAKAAGLTEDAFLQKLSAEQTKSIDAALSAGKITQEQADKQKSALQDRLKQAISNKLPAMKGGPGKQGGAPGHEGQGGPGKFGEKGMGLGLLGNADTLASILGMTKEELKTAQSAGKSLSEIAQEKGISEDALISKLKESMTDQLKKFVESKPQQRPQPQQGQQHPNNQNRQQKQMPAPSSTPATNT